MTTRSLRRYGFAQKSVAPSLRAYARGKSWWFRTDARDVWYTEGGAGVVWFDGTTKFYRPFEGVFDMEMVGSERKTVDHKKWKNKRVVRLPLSVVNLVHALLRPV